MDSKQFPVLIYHYFLMKKQNRTSSALASKVLSGLCSIEKKHYWFAEFKRNRTDTDDGERSGRSN